MIQFSIKILRIVFQKTTTFSFYFIFFLSLVAQKNFFPLNLGSATFCSNLNIFFSFSILTSQYQQTISRIPSAAHVCCMCVTMFGVRWASNWMKKKKNVEQKDLSLGVPNDRCTFDCMCWFLFRNLFASSFGWCRIILLETNNNNYYLIQYLMRKPIR